MGFLLMVFLGQVVVISVIVFVLKKILDANLVDGAIRHLEYRPEARIISVSRLLIITHKPLGEKFHQRILKALMKNFNLSAPPEFNIDHRILGGMIIWIDKEQIEYSLRDRLKQAFPVLPL